eukprot:CAMPEP_0115851978 /NCGR_PEP_ID=MMETSP0287-20121206/12757_1 /TAXON_ID=412157 /ORGANISM="Chrysochromulina rotalis, Strain UIO044" /LENGTH=579 /DNA_ID=CAMNT_0003306021 /DNA_START=24 /DNA_END=1763 /DNA_ORIENTATION=+
MPSADSDDPASRRSLLEPDVTALINMGLQLPDIERIWSNVPGVDMDFVRLTACSLLGGSAISVSRQASLALDLMRSGQASEDFIPEAVAQIQSEFENPPERFRDPITLELIEEPMVLSSGHVFSKATLYDENGKFRFTCCPMTRQTVEQHAFPLVYLKREIVEWKLRRLDGILDVVGLYPRHLLLLDLARKLLDSCGPLKYQHQAKRFWIARLNAPGHNDEQRARSLRELHDLVHDLREMEPGCEGTAAELVTLLNEGFGTIQSRVRQLWAADHHDAAVVLIDALTGRGAATSSQGSALDEDLAAELFGLIAELAVDEGPQTALLCDALAGIPWRRLHADGVAYWELCMRCATSNESRRDVAVLLCAALRSATLGDNESAVSSGAPTAIVVSGAGLAFVNGRYVLDGSYSNDRSPGVVKYSHGNIWLLRYRLPNGRAFWYLADCEQLSRNDGDYYRVASEAETPPCSADWGLAQDGRSPAPRLRAEFELPNNLSEGSTLLEGLNELLSLTREQLRSQSIDVSRLILPPHLAGAPTSAVSEDGLLGEGRPGMESSARMSRSSSLGSQRRGSRARHSCVLQ